MLVLVHKLFASSWNDVKSCREAACVCVVHCPSIILEQKLISINCP